MFFMRIRRHARWLFMFLAVLFALTFAFAGVGSGSTGVGDLMGSIGSVFGGSGGSNPVKDAQKQVDKADSDQAKLAPALRLLGKAQVAKALYTEAAATYARYLRLRPNDVQARQELAAVYKNDSDIYGNQLATVVTDVVQSAPTSLNGGGLVTDPIASGEHQNAVATASDLYKKFADPKDQELGALNTALARAKGDLRASLLVQLAGEAFNATQAAVTFGTYVPEAAQAAVAQQQAQRWAAYAVAADTALLKLHPHDSLTAQIKQQLAAVKPYAPASGK